MSVRGINKVKRELGFVLMALNIRKIAAQRAVHYKIHIKKADFYQIINRNQLFTLPKNLMSQLLHNLYKKIIKNDSLYGSSIQSIY
ncbi:hypothetical protein B6A35_05980 [Staphylococcus aureus]|nr:hypothetical protein B6A35_05980 [Staphylococcus aureus]